MWLEISARTSAALWLENIDSSQAFVVCVVCGLVHISVHVRVLVTSSKETCRRCASATRSRPDVLPWCTCVHVRARARVCVYLGVVCSQPDQRVCSQPDPAGEWAETADGKNAWLTAAIPMENLYCSCKLSECLMFRQAALDFVRLAHPRSRACRPPRPVTPTAPQPCRCSSRLLVCCSSAACVAAPVAVFDGSCRLYPFQPNDVAVALRFRLKRLKNSSFF